MRILFLFDYGRSLETWTRRFAAGDVAEETPYGLGEAADSLGHGYSYARDHDETRLSRVWRKAVARVLGTDIIHVWRNAKAIPPETELVITHNEMTSLAYAIVRALRPDLPPVVAQVIWFPEQIKGFRGVIGKWALRRADFVTTESSANAGDLASVLGRPVTAVHFGIPRRAAVEAPVAPGNAPMCAVIGNDRHRDWRLAIQVARRLPGVEFKLASRSDLSDLLGDLPSNVEILPPLRAGEVDMLLASASALLLPLRVNRHASGITTILEASDQACPVLVTRTGGLEFYLGSDYQGFVEGSADQIAQNLEGIVRSSDGPRLSSSLRDRCDQFDAKNNLAERLAAAGLGHVKMAE